MPPSGSWPSNNNLAQSTIQSNNSNHSNNHSNHINNTMEDHDVIGSLGKALSGVTLASASDGGNTGHGHGHGQGGYGSAGVGGGSGNAVGNAVGGYDNSQGSYMNMNGGSWNGLSSNGSTPSGLSYGFYGNDNAANQQPPIKTTNSNNTTNEQHDSLQNILYDSGIYEKDELHNHSTHSHNHLNTNTHHQNIHANNNNINNNNNNININNINNNHHLNQNRRSSTPPPSFESRERKQSIDIFLSQSPSKALGEDAFRVMHRTASNPSLVNIYNGHPATNSGEGGAVVGSGNNNGGLPNLKPLASTAPSSRSESPQTIRTAGTVGSSPYSNDGAGRQQLFSTTTQTQYSRMGSVGSSAVNNANDGYSNHEGNNNTQSYGYNGQQQQFKQPQFSNSSSISSQPQPHSHTQHQLPLHQQQQQQQQQQQSQFNTFPAQQQQPQVFYMAVPAPDGKGQVLQPVQMVQLPGQPPTLMMPNAMGNGQGGQMGQVMSSAGGNLAMNAQGQGQGAPVMLMQAAPPNNGMGGGASMYGQDTRNEGTNGNTGPYSPYGNNNDAQQSSGGGAYDVNNHYSSKNNGTIDSLGGGGQYQSNNVLQGPDSTSIMDGPNNNSLSMLYSSPHRPPLRALLGNVRRLSRDQVGCRLLQQALDEDGPTAATAILNEGLTFWAEAMVDPFGNYLFQKILERITPDERVILVKSVSTRLVNASLNLHGTRSVQKIVEVCAIDEEEIEEAAAASASGGAAAAVEEEGESKNDAPKKNMKKKETAAKILTDALKPSAARLCIDSHGNHAIQRILLKLPYQYTQFIFDAVAASVEDVARHRHGCCVIQRCLDSRHSAARTHLVTRIVEKSLELMQDAYGNYVVQYVLDVCGDDEVHAICESVIGKVCLLAIQKFSSNVMEKCLERCTDKVREAYLNELNDSDRLRELMMDPFGNYVVQRALSVSTHAQAIRLVETMKPHLSSQNGGGGIRNTAGGRRILGKICRRFPNFVLEGETFEDYDLNQVLQRNVASPHHQGGGRGRGQNQGYGGMPHQQPGPSPTQRRNNRNRNPHVPPPYHQQGHHVNVVQPDGNMMPPAGYHQHQAGNNPYMFHGM